MKKHLPLSLLLFGLACNKATAFHDPFFSRMMDEMDEHMRLFEERMHEVRQEMKASFTKVPTYKGISAAIEEGTEAVAINFKNIESDIKEASFSEDKNQLMIKTDQGTIKCVVRGSSIALSISQEFKEKRDENERSASYSSMSSSSMIQSIGHEVDLAKAGIEYNADAKTLTVSLPIKKEKMTAIPVTVKKSAQPQSKSIDPKIG